MAEVAWFDLFMGLFGGLALFLYGMERLAQTLKTLAGDRMRAILRALSNRRVMGLLTGAGVTAVIQSSSVTTVMLVGFVSANLMSLSQSIGVILGADIGTTITAQIIAFKVTKYALLLVAVGFLIAFTTKRQRHKDLGFMVMGLGLIFFGMAVMSDAMHPLRDYPPFMQLMGSMSHPLLGVLVGTAFTALVQSSSAAMGVIIVLATQGVISLEAGITLALGANVGTCATAGLAAIGKPREAVRVAVAHVLFKVLGVVLILPFVAPFAELVAGLTPSPDGLSGQALLAETVPRQVANAHTLFNVGIAVLFLPFTTQFARLVTRMVPDRPHAEEQAIIEAKYLNKILLRAPGLALHAARNEIERIGQRVGDMLAQVVPASLRGDLAAFEEVARREAEVDILYERVVEFLGAISRGSLTDDQTSELLRLMKIANHLETIGDIVESDLVVLGRRVAEGKVRVSAATGDKLLALHEAVVSAVRSAVRAVVEDDPELAAEVRKEKSSFRAMLEETEIHQAGRLIADEPGRMAAYALEMDVVDRLNRVFYHARRIAKHARADRPQPPRVERP